MPLASASGSVAGVPQPVAQDPKLRLAVGAILHRREIAVHQAVAAVDLDRHFCPFQRLGIGGDAVAQGIVARHGHVGRRQARMVMGGDRRDAPIGPELQPPLGGAVGLLL
jgi:hypothetical protein